MSSRSSLHYDVLLPIAQHLDHQTLFALTYSCRAGRDIALPFILGEVRLRRGWDQIQSFLDFIHTDLDHLAPLVHTLCLSAKDTFKNDVRGRQTKLELSLKAENAIPELRDFLLASVNLHTLSMTKTMGDVLGASRFNIRATLTQMLKLKHLIWDSVDDFGSRTTAAANEPHHRISRGEWYRTIAEMRGLRELQLSTFPEAMEAMLKHHETSIERIGFMNSSPSAYEFLSDFPMKLLSVHTLTVHCEIPLEWLARVFPCVRNIEVQHSWNWRRITNVDESTPVTDSENGWRSLDHVRGDHTVLRLGLTCPARRLEIDLRDLIDQLSCKDSTVDRDAYDLGVLLRRVRPRVLTMLLPSSVVAGYCKNVVTVLPELRCLELILSEWRTQAYFSSDDPATTRRSGESLLRTILVNALATFSSLEFLAVFFHEPLPAAAALASAPNLHEEISGRLGVVLDSLECLQLGWEHDGDTRYAWWRKQEQEAGPDGKTFAMFPLSSVYGWSLRQRYMNGMGD